ncbi:MAG TPA: O-methyltransferase [Acidimicrobiia bacterium]|nr:O-methyltransferase [Acidimicrobiia bacterium]
MAEMTPETWDYINSYSLEVFGAQDAHLAGLMDEATAAGLPPIAVGPDVGRLLMILTSMTKGRLAVEVGTLAGYSGIWITRGLAPAGRLITIEREPLHADFAQRQFERAGVADRVELRRGAGIDVLAELSQSLEPGSVDVLFIDAHKPEYIGYFDTARALLAIGGLVIADNVYGIGTGWIDHGYGTDEFNRHIAADPAFEAAAFPFREGVLIARRVR